MSKILRPPLAETFELPTQTELLGLKPGDFVKLIFDGDPVERMWVRLTDTSDSREWKGKFDSKPLNPKGRPALGQVVSFHPLDAIDYIRGKE